MKVLTKLPLTHPQENIAAYITGSKALGVPDEYNFMTVDLFEGKDLNQVALNVLALKRAQGHGFQKQTKTTGKTYKPLEKF
jgi:hypothetical protein